MFISSSNDFLFVLIFFSIFENRFGKKNILSKHPFLGEKNGHEKKNKIKVAKNRHNCLQYERVR
jgi:hypothetical protein